MPQKEKIRQRKSVCLQFFGIGPPDPDVQPLGDEEAMFIMVEMKEVEILLYGEDAPIFWSCCVLGLCFPLCSRMLATAQSNLRARADGGSEPRRITSPSGSSQAGALHLLLQDGKFRCLVACEIDTNAESDDSGDEQKASASKRQCV